MLFPRQSPIAIVIRVYGLSGRRHGGGWIMNSVGLMVLAGYCESVNRQRGCIGRRRHTDMYVDLESHGGGGTGFLRTKEEESKYWIDFAVAVAHGPYRSVNPAPVWTVALDLISDSLCPSHLYNNWAL